MVMVFVFVSKAANLQNLRCHAPLVYQNGPRFGGNVPTKSKTPSDRGSERHRRGEDYPDPVVQIRGILAT